MRILDSIFYRINAETISHRDDKCKRGARILDAPITPLAQPAAFASEIDWPTVFVVTYDPSTGTFQTGWGGFAHHLES